MVLGWKIVRHSFVLLFRNLGSALRVSVGPYALGLVALVLIGMAMGLPWMFSLNAPVHPGEAARMVRESAGQIVVFVLAAWAIVLLVSAWVAISWHRFVLLEEHPGLLPSVSGKPIVRYVLRVLLLVLVMIAISIPLGTVLSLIVNVFAGPPRETGVTRLVVVVAIGGSALLILMSWFWMRLALVLPAVAVGRPFGLGESWRQTGRVSGAILVALVLLVALNLAVPIVLDLAGIGGIVRLVLDLVVTWVGVMVGVSVMTTLYGMLAENRALS